MQLLRREDAGNRLHICLLTSGRISEVIYGGEEKFTISLGTWLANHNLEVTLMGSTFANVKAIKLSHLDEKNKIHLKNQRKIKLLYPPYIIFVFSRVVLLLLWIIKILTIDSRSPITLIHAQDTGYSGLAAVLSGKILRIPVIISSHGIRHKSLETIIHGRFRKALMKFEYSLDIFTIKNAHAAIAVNPSIKNYFENIISKKKLDLIPTGIKLNEFEYSEENRTLLRRQLRIDDGSIVIGYVGRFSPEKNILSLLTSFGDMVNHDPLLRLVLVGTGLLETQFKNYVRTMGIEDKVIFCGVRHDINKLLAVFDVFVLPSYTEGLSTALLEAMASGRAIICSNIPGNQELVAHNKEGLLIDPYNAEELKSAIRLLCSSESLRLTLGYNAKLRVAKYSESNIFPIILRYYRQLIKR